MSELKAHRFITTDELFPEANAGVLYYEKSEYDKVIADKDAEIAELKNEIEEKKRQRDKALALVPNVLKVMKIIQHHKYKRCLAMANMCERKRVDAANYRIPREKWEFYEKWQKRWIAIALKFKEAK